VVEAEVAEGRQASRAEGEPRSVLRAQGAAAEVARRRGLPGRGKTRFGLGRRFLDVPRTARNRLFGSARIAFRRQRPKKRRLFVLLDVSGSMEAYVGRYLPALFALVRERDVRVFAFATGVAEVTEALRQGGEALEAVRFGRGTLLGDAIAALLEDPKGPTPRDDVLIISDGWEAGDREAFVAALVALRRRCRQLIWWNPDVATKGFRPTSFAMRVVRRLADILESGPVAEKA